MDTSHAIIDLDANASTRPAIEVVEAMQMALLKTWGNEASDNILGQAANQEVRLARSAVARLIGASDDQIYFTSGSTEAINLGLQGLVRAHNSRPVHVVTSLVEHDAVSNTLLFLRDTKAIEVTALKPDRLGRITPQQVRGALRENTLIVSLIHGNNEIGTLNPIHAIGEVIRDHPAYFFVDASQTMGYFPPQVEDNHIDLLCVSAHKLHGPKGVGALYVRHGVPLEPITFGGGQEQGYRSGTLNVPGIIGLGVAARLVEEKQLVRTTRVRQMQQQLLTRLQEGIPRLILNGDPVHRLPSNLSLTFPYVPARHLQKSLPHLALSRGSACSSVKNQSSHVLNAIGLTREAADWTIRIGLSEMNNDEELERAAADLIAFVKTYTG